MTTKTKIVAAGLLIAASSVAAQASALTCTVDVNSTTSLQAMTTSETCVTFAVSSSPAYVQNCSNGFKVTIGEYSPVYKHYHLSFEDSTISCLASNSCFGKQVGSACNAIDTTTVARLVSAHASDEWISFTHNWTATKTTFKSIYNRGTLPIDVFWETSTGTWLVATDLAAGTVWNISNAQKIKRVVIHQDAPVSATSWKVDDLKFEYTL